MRKCILFISALLLFIFTISCTTVPKKASYTPKDWDLPEIPDETREILNRLDSHPEYIKVAMSPGKLFYLQTGSADGYGIYSKTFGQNDILKLSTIDYPYTRYPVLSKDYKNYIRLFLLTVIHREVSFRYRKKGKLNFYLHFMDLLDILIFPPTVQK